MMIKTATTPVKIAKVTGNVSSLCSSCIMLCEDADVPTVRPPLGAIGSGRFSFSP